MVGVELSSVVLEMRKHRYSPNGLRRRPLLLAAVSGAISKVANTLCSLIAIPLTLAALGKSGFAVFSLVSGSVAILPFADLGLGLGLVTLLASARARSDSDEETRLVSTAMAALALLALLFAAIAGIAAIYPGGIAKALAVPVAGQWGSLRSLVLVTGCAYAAGLFLTVGYKILIALGEVHRANIYQLFGSLFALLGVVGAWATGQDAYVFAAANMVAPLVVASIAIVSTLSRRYPELRPRFRFVRLASLRPLLKLGGTFALQGAAFAIAFQLDAVVISHLVGIDGVATYSVVAKLAILGSVVTSSIFVPLWPVFSALIARGDLAQVSRRLRRSLILASLAGSLLWMAFLAAGPLISLWTSGKIHASPLLLAGVGAWTFGQLLWAPLCILLNGAAIAGFQVVVTFAMALSNLVLSVALTILIGISGPAWASGISVLLFGVAPYVAYVHKRLLPRLRAEALLPGRAVSS